MEGYHKEILLSKEQIQGRVRELALEISRDYEGKEPILIGILNGVIFFFTDLIRNMAIPIRLDFIRAKSYGAGTESSGIVRFLKDIEIDVRGQDIIVVEDIVDTGLTLSKIKENLEKRGPKSVKICVLIDKRERRETEVAIDYCGFHVEEGFIVGYGLDINERYRHLPDIFVLKERRLRVGGRQTIIIQCEKCKTKFRLDASLLKEQGSKVRCSVCSHTFMAYPAKDSSSESLASDLDEEFREAVTIDGAGAGEEAVERPQPKIKEEIDFEKKALAEEVEENRESERDLTEEPVVEPLPEERGEVHLLPKKSKVGLIILIIVFVIVAGAAAVVYFAPQMIAERLSLLKMPEKKSVKDLGVRRLSFKAVTGTFVNSQSNGQLFVVKGMVVNDYPKPRSFILVKASILDEKGNVVRSKRSYAGNSFSEQELQELPIQEIENAMKNPRGRDGSNVNVAPGASIPFMIVFQNLPKDLSEFTVEAVSSSPGQK